MLGQDVYRYTGILTLLQAKHAPAPRRLVRGLRTLVFVAHTTVCVQSSQWLPRRLF